MSICAPSQRDSLVDISSLGRQLFDSPQPAGRRITAGFTYLQRISKAASFDVWFPETLKRQLSARKASGKSIGAEQFPAEWAAVRQFELLHESGNHKIYDLDPTYLTRTTLDLARSMRAGGYRITVATLGCYQETSTGDELEILDRELQERIAQMIQMLYLEQNSDQANAENDAHLAAQKWDYRQDLPHVGMVLGAGELFKRFSEVEDLDDEDEDYDYRKRRKKGGGTGGSARVQAARKHKQAREFFKILGLLPQNHIVHDTAIGLQLPELNGRNQWNYIASPDETLGAFNRVLNDLFDKFNGISMSRLQGCDDGHSEIKSSTYHMRSYGDHLNESSNKFYRSASLALN